MISRLPCQNTKLTGVKKLFRAIKLLPVKKGMPTLGRYKVCRFKLEIGFCCQVTGYSKSHEKLLLADLELIT